MIDFETHPSGTAARIASLEAENERLNAIIDNSPLDELHGCDCCGATTTDAAEVDGHMQCRACTLDAQLATAGAKLEAAFRAGWIAGGDACGETNVDPDTDSGYQIARQAFDRHQAAKAAEGEANASN